MITVGHGFFNFLDSIVVVTGWIEVALVQDAATQFGFLRGFRLVRLFRIFKFFKHWSSGRSMWFGIWDGFMAAIPILLLFLLFIFVFALLFVRLYREIDPFHFGNLERAVISLYLASTMSWADIFYICYFGCAEVIGLNSLFLLFYPRFVVLS